MDVLDAKINAYAVNEKFAFKGAKALEKRV